MNVAKYSPSGFYIASAGEFIFVIYTVTVSFYLQFSFSATFTDQSGKVRIWDTVNKEHICKIELQPFAGPIKDLAWSADNQRMVVVGEGREW